MGFLRMPWQKCWQIRFWQLSEWGHSQIGVATPIDILIWKKVLTTCTLGLSNMKRCVELQDDNSWGAWWASPVQSSCQTMWRLSQTYSTNEHTVAQHHFLVFFLPPAPSHPPARWHPKWSVVVPCPRSRSRSRHPSRKTKLRPAPPPSGCTLAAVIC